MQERAARISAESALSHAEALRRDYDKERALRLEAQGALREAQAVRDMAVKARESAESVLLESMKEVDSNSSLMQASKYFFVALPKKRQSDKPLQKMSRSGIYEAKKVKYSFVNTISSHRQESWTQLDVGFQTRQNVEQSAFEDCCLRRCVHGRKVSYLSCNSFPYIASKACLEL